MLIAVLAATVFSQAAPQIVLERRLPLDQLETGVLADGDIGSDGSIILLDQSNRLIYRFRSTGSQVDTLGRRGKGPGEFEMAGELEVGPDGQVAIADITNRRVTVWSRDKTVATIAITDLVYDLAWSASGLFLMTGSWDGTGGLEILRVAGGTPARHATVPLGGTAPPISCTFCDFTVAEDGRMFTAAPDTVFAVHQLDGFGRMARRFSRPGFRLARWTVAELVGLEAQTRRRGIPWNPDRFRFKRPLQAHSLAVDGAGRLWLRPTVAGGTGAMFDVFGADGRHLATLRVAESLSGFAVRGNRLLGWGEDSDGVPRAMVYRIQ